VIVSHLFGPKYLDQQQG